MRIPHIIDENTLKVYTPSTETEDLVGENERKLVAENFDWNQYHCKPLIDFCVEVISKNFEKKPLLDELPCPDRDYLLEILSTDLPLELIIPIIDDEYYWRRRYKIKFGSLTYRKPKYWTWKTLYVERHVREMLEQAQPQYNDEETMEEILTLCSPYTRRVMVTQLQQWNPPLTMEKEDIPETYPIEHINFIFVFRKLPNLEEFHLVFGMNQVSESFNWNMFKVSVTDCQRLGKGLLELKQLKVLRIYRSKIQFKHCQALMQNLIKNRSLVELDLSNNQLGDKGALCVAKVLGVHPTLKKLNLANNQIGKLGAEGIGYTMVLDSCAKLDVLNLRLNPLGKEGSMGIMRGLVRCDIPKELSMSACSFHEDTAIKISQMIKLNESLKRLDVSSNWFGEDAGEELVQALEVNTTLEWLDMRETNISLEQEKKIKQILLRNRTGVMETELGKQSICENEELEEKMLMETVYDKGEENHEEINRINTN